MGQNRYGKYVLTPPIKMGGPFGPMAEYTGEEHYGSQFSIMFFHITQPVLMEETPHSHDFDFYLFFLGRDDLEDLGAEIEIGLGEEQEIHTITTPASVYVPRGMIHCPLNFKRVDKPVLFAHALLAPKYTRVETR